LRNSGLTNRGQVLIGRPVQIGQGRDREHGAQGANFALQLERELLRLDLGRVGIVPRPERLCIAQARDPVLFERAHRRSVR